MGVGQVVHARPGPAPPLRWPSRGAFTIGCGEAGSRALNLLLLVFISRRLGVKSLGAFALAQGISLYLLQGTDLGLRHIGARLVAEDATSLPAIVRLVQGKRMLLAAMLVPLGIGYGRLGPVPIEDRTLVSLYALSVFPYALSLDWLAWGLKCFAWLSFWRISVSAVTCAISIFAIDRLSASLKILAFANGAGYGLAALLLWLLWARPLVKATRTGDHTRPSQREGTAWSGVVWLGFALLANQALVSGDVLILGALRTSTETGLYSAAYRLLLLVTVIYYFVTQALYPQLAAIPPARRRFGVLWPYLWRTGIAGLGITLMAELARKSILLLLFGPDFAPSVALAGPLLLAIAPDFLASLLMTALTAWNRPRLVLLGTGLSAGSNLLLNLLVIPRFGAMGAAYVTPVSFCLLFSVLALGLRASAAEGALQASQVIREPS